MVIIAAVAIVSTIVVMTQRSQDHLRWARFYEQQKQEVIRRIDVEAEGVAYCREGLARVRKPRGGDGDLKAWMHELPSYWRTSGDGSLTDKALKIWTDRLVFWESEAEIDRERVATLERLRLMYVRA